jgi:hypothetical protein
VIHRYEEFLAEIAEETSVRHFRMPELEETTRISLS